MLKKSLIAIAVLALLIVTAHADDPWPSSPIYGDPQIIGYELAEVEMIRIPVRMPIVRWAEITLEEDVDHVNIEQVEPGVYQGCINILICNNFPNMLLTAYIYPVGPLTAERYLVSLEGPGGLVEDEATSMVWDVHLTGNLGSRWLCARLEEVDLQSAPFQEEKIDCAEIVITAQPQ
jgi:hypothetical protein